MKRPKGVIIFGVIFIMMSIIHMWGFIVSLYRLKHYDILLSSSMIIINFILSAIFILGFFYSAFKILNLNYKGVIATYFICGLWILNAINHAFFNLLKDITNKKIIIFILGIIIYMVVYFLIVSYFKNINIKKYFIEK
ncbi:MAG: hypothetical protein M1308_16195 [Actinobacteria bacterium]|nr:hypothetical protein [Actinomycetota bacterium]